jgi:hypothetical protein
VEELGKSGNEGMVLHASEMACARMRILSVKEDEEVPEIAENEIEYIVDEKPVLDELKIYGKVLSKEQKAKKEEGGKDKGKEKVSKSGNEARKVENEKSGSGKQVKQGEEGEKKATVERKTSYRPSLILVR